MNKRYQDHRSLSAEEKRQLLAGLLAKKVQKPKLFPLSFAQQRLWILDQLEPGNALYNVPAVLKLHGLLDVQAFERSIKEIVHRHEALRTTFAIREGEPVQIVAPSLTITIPILDLDVLLPDDQEAEAQRLIAEEVQSSFDLSKPLIRGKWLQIDEQKHILLLNMHHIVADGWSMEILLRELSILYSAFLQRLAPSLPELPIQYADFAVWQRQQLQGEALENMLAYWREQLTGLPVLQLPTDRPRPATQSFRGATHTEMFPSTLLDSLKELSQREGVSLFMTLLAAFNVLLYRHTGQDDIGIGTGIANRNRKEVEELIGFFVNTLVLRTRMAGNPEFREILRRVRDVALGAYAHQDLPFEKLVDELQPERNLSIQPLFQVMFTFHNFPLPVLELGGVTMMPMTMENKTAKFDLSLSLIDTEQGLAVGMEYSTDLFDASTIEGMVRRWRILLEAIVANPEQRLSQLTILSPVERRRLLKQQPFGQLPLLSEQGHALLVGQWQSRPGAYLHEATLSDLFEEQVASQPEAIALVSAEQQVSYGELDRRASLLAAALQDAGVDAEVGVGICLERSVQQIVGLLGILKAGGYYVPLEPHAPLERQRFQIRDAHVRLILSATHYREQLTQVAPRDVPVWRLDEADAAWLQGQKGPEEGFRDARTLAYVLYTSGSTGRPKGVSVSQQAVVRLVKGNWFVDLNAQEVLLYQAPLAFDASTLELWGSLLNGARLVIGAAELQSVEALGQQLQEEQVSTLWLTAGLFHQMVQEQLAALTAVRQVLAGGDVLGVGQVRALLEARQGRGVVINGYGPTENTTFTCCYPMQQPEQVTERVPIGYPLANTTVYVLDELRQVVPVGVIGELYTGGAGLARGYQEQAEQTAEYFVPDPFGQEVGGRLYRTGDLVRWRQDGSLEFVGRRDNQVKVRGYRIELGEVELALGEQEAVRDVVVIVQNQSGNKRLVAYVVPREAAQFDWMQVREALQRRLPDYMLPALCVTLDELPLTPNGKVDRRALPEPDTYYNSVQQEYSAPRTEIEEQLAQIWQQVLDIEQIGVQDNFFALGGDSILGIQISSRARQRGIALAPRQLFLRQTIAELAMVATYISEGEVSVVEQGLLQGRVPLTPIQRWFFEQEQPAAWHWNQAIMMQSRYPLKPHFLQDALIAVFEQHDSLRLRFRHSKEEGWLQAYGEQVDVSLIQMDLSNVLVQDRQEHLEAVSNATQASLNLEQGPLLRAVLVESGEETSQQLLVVCHHLVIDGVSWRILLEDLQQAYQQRAQGEIVYLPARTSSWQHWGQALGHYAQDELVTKQLAFWQQQLERKVASLPLDYSEGENVEAATAQVSVSLSVEETHALLHAVPQVYHTQINDVLLTALVQALQRWTGEQTWRIALEGHGREPIHEKLDLSRTIGWFTTLYPVVLELPSRVDREGSALKAIKEQLRAIPEHGLGYGLLRYLCTRSDVLEQRAAWQKTPWAQISFNYLGQFDQVINEAGLFASSAGSSGMSMGPKNHRQHLLDVSGGVSGGQLHLNWTYSQNRHKPETIARLAQNYVEALRALITHCRSPEAGGSTPSDFPLARLDQKQLDALIGQQQDIEAIYPLAPLQQGLLFQSLYAPQSGDYITQIQFALLGKLDEHAWMQAWQRVMVRHTILRTAFVWEALEEPLQIIYRWMTLPVAQLDWRSYASEEQQQRLKAYLQDDRAAGFTLSEAPLQRLTLVRLGEECYECVWTHHHLLLDGWSLGTVLKEVFVGYKATTQGQVLQWESPRPYQDYIVWLKQQNGSRVEAFWRRTLEGFTHPTVLSMRKAANQEGAEHFGQTEILQQWTAEETQMLQRFVRQRHLTLNTLALGAWALLLSRYSGQRDVLFGAVVAGRPPEIAGIQEMVGLFINTLPVRVQIRSEQSVLSWLQELQEQQSELRQYEYTSLAQVQSWSQMPGGVALFESLFIFENYPLDGVREAGEETGVRIEALQASDQTHYPLSLAIWPGQQLGIKLTYDNAHFEEHVIKRILNHLVNLLKVLIVSPHSAVGSVPLLTEVERQEQLSHWNSTHQQSFLYTSIQQLFEVQVHQHPEAIALLSDEGQMSYRELNRRANQLAHLLHARGVGPEVLVGLCLPRSQELLVGLLGILKAGGAYVPLDPSYPPERLHFQIQDAQLACVLTRSDQRVQLPLAPEDCLALDVLWPQLAEYSGENLVDEELRERLAYVIYTSGSTGMPKGVAISHRSTLRLLHWARDCFGTSLEAQVLASTSICFDLSVYELLGPLSWGGQVVLVENALLWPEQVSAQEVYLVNTVPSAMQELVRSQRVPTSVRVVNLAGEALSRQLVEQLYALEHIEAVYNLYGPSEDTTYSTWARLEREEAGPVPIGRAVKGTQAYVLDADLQLVPVGVMGELYLGGAGLARGYLGRQEQTAERFVPNPFGQQAGGRLYRTGDLVRWREDGQLDYLGRQDSQVKVRGYRIELGEIEQELRKQDGVHEAVVVVQEQERGSKRLVAYIVPTDPEQFKWVQIREALAVRLPDYMLPSLCVQLEQLPLTPNGKVDRRALPDPEEIHLSHEREYAAPQQETEKKLVEIWGEVLGIKQIGIHDNFFVLGGDSILSLQIISRARQRGLFLTPRQLFQQQTIAQLATVVQQKNQALVLAKSGSVGALVPLTPIQRWFFEQEQPEPWHWNQTILVQSRHSLEPQMLEEALAAVLQQHDTLRLRFLHNKEEGWQQFYGEEERVFFSRVDLTALPSAAAQLLVQESVADMVQASLNLENGPLWRVVIFSKGEQDWLLFVCHHLLVDGVSWRILLEDLQQAYLQCAQGKTVSLPARTNSWQQWSGALERYAQAEEVVKQLAFWQHQGEQIVASLPLDDSEGENTVASVGQVSVSLSVEETYALLHEVPQAYHTQINDILLTALVQTLQRWTGEGCWRIALEGHGREPIHEELDLARTVGWFTTLYPVVLNLPANTFDDMGDALKTIKEQLRTIPEHGLGYGLLRYLCVQPEVLEQKALWGREMLAQISFNYLGQFDQVVNEKGLFTPATGAVGLLMSPRGHREQILDINSGILQGQLQVHWSYSSNRHRRDTIEALAQDYIQTLRSLIAHCQLTETGGYTPSDFPLSLLSQEQIDLLLGNNRQVEAVYPLSHLQKGLLFQTLYEPDMGDYTIQVGWSLQGKLDVDAFNNAWQAVIDRYAILRTSFAWAEIEEPQQIVWRQKMVPMRLLDWRMYTETECRAQLDLCWQEDRAKGFDLTAAPAMRLTLIQTQEDSYEFFWTYHHLLLDGWSLGIVLKEVFERFKATTQGETPSLGPVRPYQNYISWLKQQDPLKAEIFWRAWLQGFSTPTKLAVERKLNRVAEDRVYAEQTVQLSEEMTLALQKFARAHHLTVNTLVQGAWGLLLAHYSGQDDVVFGTTIAGRPTSIAGIEAMVGMFINTLPVRVHLDPALALLNWLHDLQMKLIEMQQYEYSSLTQVQRWSEVPQGISLFESLVVFENYPLSGTTRETDAQLKVRELRSIEQTHYPLTLVVTPEPYLSLRLLYERACFDAGVMTRLLRHVQTLLESLEMQCHVPLATVSLLSLAEQQQALTGWNETGMAYSRELCVHQLFEAQVAHNPTAVAAVCGDVLLTYEDLNRRANHLAHHLQARGIKVGTLVGICVERSLDFIVGLLGILKLGAAYVPLDLAYPKERLVFMLEDAQISILLTQQRLLEKLPHNGVEICCLDTDLLAASAQDEENLVNQVTAEDLAYVIYTSGSTGRPKGVAITHAGLLNLVFWHIRAYEVGPKDRATQLASMAFDACVWEIWPYLVAGASLHIPDEETRLSPPLLQDWLINQAITISFLPTPLAEELLVLNWPRAVPLRFMLTGGDKLQRCPTLAMNFKLVNHYGPTEATVVATAGVVLASEGAEHSPSIGRPIANTQAYILDRHLQPVAIGVVGELYIASVGLAWGYWGRPDLTSERFLAHPFSREAGARIYKTGDLVRYLPAGNIEFLGRIDEQVKVRGYRIELGEIENVLDGHPAINKSVVIVRTEASGRKHLVAYVITVSEMGQDADELQRYLQLHLPAYMLPSTFVFLEALPLTPGGKVDRRALPAPEELYPNSEQGYVIPRTELEEQLANIWRQVLGMKQLGVHDNFFALGGDSILSIQLVALARQRGIYLTPKQLFQKQTIAELSAVAQTSAQAVVAAEQGQIWGSAPLTPIQRWFFEQEQPAAWHWNQSALLQTRQPVEPQALEEALTAVLRQHDSLRLRFQRSNEGWQQSYARQERIPLVQVDLSNVLDRALLGVLEAVADMTQASLDLEQGPMLHAALLDLGGARGQRLLIVCHHLVVDVVSWRLLLEDLELSYSHVIQGVQIQLPVKTNSWQQWTGALADYAQAESIVKQLAFWQRQEQQAVAALPLDHSTGENTVASAEQVSVSLSVEETYALLHEVPPVYHTQINDVLLTGLVLALQRWTGEGRWRIALEGHGREPIQGELDLSRTVGWFTTLYPLVLNLPSEAQAEPGTALKAVKEQLRTIPEHGLGYGLLRYLSILPDVIEPRISWSEGSLAEISFNYLGQFDQAISDEQVFGPATKSSGMPMSPQSRRQPLLEINGSISGGQLHLNWTYSRNRHRQETIATLAQDYLEALRLITKHCQAPQAGGHTPSDFPLARLSQEQLDRLVGQRHDIEQIYPLSSLQQGLLFQSLYAPNSGDYVTQISFTLQGKLDEIALLYAWQEVLQRHAILRTAFVWEDLDQPHQVVSRQGALPHIQLDWTALSPQEQEVCLQIYVQEDRERSFVLKEAPLMRLTLIRLQEQCYECLWTHHHILLDGWSLPIVLKDVFACYQSLLQNQYVQSTAPRPYQDYLAWLGQQDEQQAEAYWRRTLAGVSSPIQMQIEQDMAADQPHGTERAELQVALPSSMSQQLQQYARREHLTLNTLVLGAWMLVLSRYSGQRDVLCGMVVSGRPAEITGIEEMVGLFINTVPVRMQVSPEQGVMSWLQHLQEQQSEQRPYEYSSLAQVQSWSSLPAGTALFDSLFVFENYPLGEVAEEETSAVHIAAWQTQEQIHYPLTLFVLPGAQLELKLHYDRSRFAPPQMQQLLTHLQHVLAGFLVSAERPLGTIELLSAQERAQLVQQWQPEAALPTSETAIQQFFEVRVCRHPEAIAVLSEDGQLSYGELNRRANQLAHLLQERGVGPEVLVGLCLPRSPELLIGLLGILKAGGAYVPLDPSYPPERLRFQIQDAQLAFVLTRRAVQAALALPADNALVLETLWSEVDKQSSDDLVDTDLRERLAYVIYTSGSTGIPKGVAISHRSTLRLLHWARDCFGSALELQVLASTSICFDLSVYELLGPLSWGGQVVLVENALQWPEQVSAQGVCLVNTVPSAMQELVRSQRVPTSVRVVNLAGEALSRQLVEQLYALEHIEAVYNLYGPSEDTTYSTWARLEREEVGSVTIGRAVKGTQAYVLDADRQLVPVGVTGELYLGGAGLARGYLGRQEQTAERFVPNPFGQQAGGRLYRTGDLVRWRDDGQLDYLGRQDSQVKVRGYRIELGEIEQVLREQDSVHEVAVVVDQERRSKRLVAYVVPEDPGTFSWKQVREMLAGRLPEYMLPALCVQMDQLPLTPNGKVDRRALPEPGAQQRSQQQGYRAPRTERGTTGPHLEAGVGSGAHWHS